MTIHNQAAERIFLGLGSNLGDRLRYLRHGVAELKRKGIRPMRSSSVYESVAHLLGSDLQPDYLNAVVEVETSIEPDALLRILLHTEREAGRRREAGSRWQPRTLDLDILLYGDRNVRMPNLSIPHPRLAERRFVLEPLAEIAAEVVVPVEDASTVAALLARCADGTAVTPLHPPSILLNPPS